MPLISARMSASSSTTRMSCAMRGFHSAGFGIGIRTGIGFGGVGARFEALEAQGDARAAAAAILERQLPTMVLHDLLHDRQAQPGSGRWKPEGARGAPPPASPSAHPPRWSSMILFTIARPRPVPLARVVT